MQWLLRPPTSSDLTRGSHSVSCFGINSYEGTWVRTRPTILYFGPVGGALPDLVRQWAEGNGFPLEVHADPAQVESIVLRGHPCFLFIDADGMGAAGISLVRRLKSDPFTAIIPALVLAGTHDAEQIQGWFAAGADEIFTGVFPPAEQRARLDALLVRTQRDVSVHPSTRMPGTTEIEREIRRRLEGSQEFAVCYADLDHFKEYNDRYSYYDGDRVIYILSRILHDVVKGLLGSRGFVGHIGGDDFIFIIPAAGYQPGLRRDPGGVRYAGAIPVQRAGPAGGLFLREGSSWPAAPCAADDPFGGHRHQPAPGLRASGRSQ